MEPIFKTSLMGFKVSLFPNFIRFKQSFFGPEIIIELNQIASIEKGMPGLQKIVIETTGGRKIDIIVKLGDKDKFIDAIYEAKAKL